MARYEITSPDGKRFEITAPDDATSDQVLEYAKSQWSKNAAPSKPPALPAEDVPGIGQTLLIGAGRTFDRIGKGMQQLFAGPEEAAKLKADAESDDQQYQKLKDARPFATAIGESIPSMVVPAGGSATLIGNAGRMALAGAIPGALEYGSAEERAKRGIVGGVAGALAPVVGLAAKTGYSFLEPLRAKGREAIAGRTLNRVAGDSAPDVVRRLQTASEIIPGSKPTAAQVANSGGIAAMERAAAAMNPEDYAKRAMEQSSARLNALRGIAGDESSLAAAIKDRAVTAEKGYRHAFQAGIDTDMAKALQPQINSLLERPSVQKAMAHARELAAENGMKFDDLGSVEGLHYLKLSLDDLAEAASKTPEKKRLIEQTSRDLHSVLAEIAPEYKAAMARYADKSGPINRMQTGQALQAKLQPALADFGALASETGANFGQALRSGDAIAARATGMPGMTLQRAIGPNGVGVMESIAADLARKSNAQNLGRGVGSDTFQKLSMANIAQQSGMPRIVGGLLDLPGISRATSWAYRETDQKMQSLLADAFLDPSKAATLMQKADQKWLGEHPAIRRALEQTALRGGGLLGMSMTPSLTD